MARGPVFRRGFFSKRWSAVPTLHVSVQWRVGSGGGCAMSDNSPDSGTRAPQVCAFRTARQERALGSFPNKNVFRYRQGWSGYLHVGTVAQTNLYFDTDKNGPAAYTWVTLHRYNFSRWKHVRSCQMNFKSLRLARDSNWPRNR